VCANVQRVAVIVSAHDISYLRRFDDDVISHPNGVSSGRSDHADGYDAPLVDTDDCVYVIAVTPMWSIQPRERRQLSQISS
jgi:hypothetical protein